MHSTGRRMCGVLLSGLLAHTSLSGTQQATPQQPPPTSTSSKFALDDGTPVRLRLNRNVSSADAKTGDNIDFEVLEEVKVGEVIRILQADGWAFHSQKGSHRHFKHSSKPGRVTVAGKPSLDLHPKTLASILKQAGIDNSGGNN